ncbi:MAG: chemotaxis protein CheB [Nitrospirae bacterium]|nr:chemotaxis protein CheB [Candidatus Manganitrophaceae bacterium]
MKKNSNGNGRSRTRSIGRRPNHDIIVIGTSAGGVEALIELVGGFPPDLPAAVFVVIHLASFQDSTLPQILSRNGALPAAFAVHGETIRTGRIYLAPPDAHLMLQPDHVRVIRGPKENGHRPAVDPLFRTAARAFESRVVGVILTGALDCGTAGLLSVKARGGLAVVQDPNDAFCADMPRSALRHVKVDYVLPLLKIPSQLARLAREPAIQGKGEKMRRPNEQGESNGTPVADLTCPECSGALKETEVNGLLQFNCHVGHVYSEESMLMEQGEATEAALWGAVRALQESENLARRMATRSDASLSARFYEKAEAAKQHWERIRNILLNGEGEDLVEALKPSPPRKQSKPASRRVMVRK